MFMLIFDYKYLVCLVKFYIALAILFFKKLIIVNKIYEICKKKKQIYMQTIHNSNQLQPLPLLLLIYQS